MGLFSKLKKLRFKDIGTGKNLKKIGQGVKQMKFGEGMKILGGLGSLGIGGLGSLASGGLSSLTSGGFGGLLGKMGDLKGGQMFGEGGFFGGIGKNLFGLSGKNAGAGGLGFGMETLGQLGQMFPRSNTGYERGLNRALNPLQQSADKFGELASQYEDPNSSLNQGMRRDIRTQNLEGFTDIARRQRNKATGMFDENVNKNIDSNMLSGAIAKALESHSLGASDRMKTAMGLYGQQSTLNSALAQGQLRNKLLAQQQQAMPYQWLGQTGAGLLNRAYNQPEEQPEIVI